MRFRFPIFKFSMYKPKRDFVRAQTFSDLNSWLRKKSNIFVALHPPGFARPDLEHFALPSQN